MKSTLFVVALFVLVSITTSLVIPESQQQGLADAIPVDVRLYDEVCFIMMKRVY